MLIVKCKKMCSINGFNFQDESLIKKMNKITKHRGPDDSDIFISKKWSLGHNRLSIIDLTKAGHQPMLARPVAGMGGFSEDKKLSIIFNGEMYNWQDIKKELLNKGYKFKSATDTEVVLYAYQEWGSKCLQKFNGMFALAILNIETEELFLARDRIGIKPLYYYHKDNQFIFSSEVKAILEHQVETPLNMEALNIYFRLLYVPSPITMWQNIFKLEPGHYAIIKNNNIKIEKYWEIANQSLIKDKAQIENEVSRLLKDSVQMRLMSDRPVGAFLSGGIDSTIITGIMSESSNQVNTFSVGFEETEEMDKYNNDFLVARKTAKHFKTNHHELILSADDIKNNLAKTIYHMDEPISNHIQTVNMLLARYTIEQVKVVLGGDGGDELFGGYERYYYNYLIDRIQLIPKIVRQNFLAEFIFKLGNKQNLYNKLNSRPGVERYLSFFAQKEDMIAKFLTATNNQPNFLPSWLEQEHFSKINKQFTRQFMQTDLKTWMPNESLVRSDKMSMASGLEQRVPFLDHRLVELADRIPLKYKIGKKGLGFSSVGRNYEGKIILKSAMKDYLPEFVVHQPKWGWFSPAAKWLRGPLHDYAREILSPSYCEGTRELFNFEQINKIFDNHINKKQYALNTIWSLMTFQIWYKEFMDK